MRSSRLLVVHCQHKREALDEETTVWAQVVQHRARVELLIVDHRLRIRLALYTSGGTQYSLQFVWGCCGGAGGYRTDGDAQIVSSRQTTTRPTCIAASVPFQVGNHCDVPS